MISKSYFVKFTENKCHNSRESGSGKVCAVKKTSTGEWLKKFGEKDLDSENVLYVCSSDCKKCDFNPNEKSCNGSQAIAIVYGAKLTVQVRDESDRDI
ncbi:MAG: hypothetical protein KAS94_04440 [Desulfobulbaceae bacterium]|nr:hypothetical protein [Desulfobulbaceae bacterium]